MLAVLDCDLGEVVLQECEFRFPFMRRGTELLASPRLHAPDNTKASDRGRAARRIASTAIVPAVSQVSLVRVREKERKRVPNKKERGILLFPLGCTRDNCDTPKGQLRHFSRFQK
jgi:hypothetical protein